MQFALMGNAFAEAALGRHRPTIGLLSNGAEPNKGTESLPKPTDCSISSTLSTSASSKATMLHGVCEVVVTDGLVGNVTLKLRALAVDMYERLETLFSESLIGALAVRLAKKSMTRLREELDWENVGGAPILGLDCIAYITHGNASPKSIENAIRRAREAHATNLSALRRDSLRL